MRSVSASFLCLLLACTLVQAEAPPIQQWIDEAIQAGGGVVTIPEGEHILEKGLVIKNAKKLALRGVDKERCILKLAPRPETKGVMQIIEVSGSCETLEIAGLTLDGKTARESLVPHLILMDGISAPSGSGFKDIHVRDCMFQHFSGMGIHVQNTEGCVVERCSFRDGEVAVGFYHESKECVARGNQIIRVEDPFHLSGASNCLIVGNESWGSGILHIRHYQNAGEPDRHIIRDNAFQGAELFWDENAPQPLTEGNEGLVLHHRK